MSSTNDNIFSRAGGTGSTGHPNPRINTMQNNTAGSGGANSSSFAGNIWAKGNNTPSSNMFGGGTSKQLVIQVQESPEVWESAETAF